MSPDIVSQMGAMVVRAILTAMALVASLTGVILFVETLRRWRNWETKSRDDNREPDVTPTVTTSLSSFQSACGPKTLGWYRHAGAMRFNSNRAGLRIGRYR